MTPSDYQRLRRQLDDELRAAIEMLHAGHRAKVEALDARWLEAAAETAESDPAPPPPEELPTVDAPEQPPRERRGAGEVLADVEAALEKVGDEFLKSDLCRALGYQPRRSSLHRALWELQKRDVIEVQTYGVGRRANRYRKARRKEEG